MIQCQINSLSNLLIFPLVVHTPVYGRLTHSLIHSLLLFFSPALTHTFSLPFFPMKVPLVSLWVKRSDVSWSCPGALCVTLAALPLANCCLSRSHCPQLNLTPASVSSVSLSVAYMDNLDQSLLIDP